MCIFVLILFSCFSFARRHTKKKSIRLHSTRFFFSIFPTKRKSAFSAWLLLFCCSFWFAQFFFYNFKMRYGSITIPSFAIYYTQLMHVFRFTLSLCVFSLKFSSHTKRRTIKWTFFTLARSSKCESTDATQFGCCAHGLWTAVSRKKKSREKMNDRKKGDREWEKSMHCKCSCWELNSVEGRMHQYQLLWVSVKKYSNTSHATRHTTKNGNKNIHSQRKRIVQSIIFKLINFRKVNK